MKQILLSILLLFLPMVAAAETVKINGIYYNLITKIREAEVTKNPNGYYNIYGSIVIPKSVTYDGVEYSVTSLDDNAFQYSRGLTSVTIPNSVVSIGSSAFSGCSGLTSMVIPNSVKSIGGQAFSSCI